MRAMPWIRPHVSLAPFAGRFSRVRLLERGDAGREEVERFIAEVYRERYGARLRAFLPHLLAYDDGEGRLAAAVGLRSGGEGRLFVEQYLDAPVEQAIAQRHRGRVDRRSVVEVGNFAAGTPGIARELILQVGCVLRSARMEWVLFVATQQLRNAFRRLHLAPVDLAEASAERLDDGGDWGGYYATRPRVMCGNMAEGFALPRSGALAFAPGFPELCMAGAS